MPRNTSGLRRGGPGRHKGSKDRVPRSFRASIRRMYEHLVTTEPQLFEDAIRRDLQNRRGVAAFHHVQLAAHYLDGKPADQVNLSGEVNGGLPVVIINDFTTDGRDKA